MKICDGFDTPGLTGLAAAIPAPVEQLLREMVFGEFGDDDAELEVRIQRIRGTYDCEVTFSQARGVEATFAVRWTPDGDPELLPIGAASCLVL